ncbi:lysyl-tRNA synthetase [Saprolegnia parasitica CBS 223.65]|uniref:Lysine--tRNA ligase n=1 Tax=Saprolegnia parasitica (strain CBS 223.65) TaxID=695850 RepID=A0A067CT49_SAPPC|nr:lysyl-tRNA synthetase [Saprolegnia parasitica CBS 223.65]KDO33884.1 lysyl-tRNA synthetase [Saprolegnia parasitica CBS 223.65]|eukprot:XP_012195520.1 lysyl-tRNA synthetase [Saprolegnia parasitica CBS 223.65]
MMLQHRSLLARSSVAATARPWARLFSTTRDDKDEDMTHRRFEDIEGYTRYPNHFPVTMTVKDFIAKYDDLPAKARLSDVPVSLAGRITSIRAASKKLIFLDICNDGHEVQVLAERKHYANADDTSDKAFEHVHDSLRRGDIIGVHGFPGKSGKGELSIIPQHVSVLSPCLAPFPNSKYGLKEIDIRFRQKYLDLLTNKDVRGIFTTRAKVIQYIRRYLEDRDFIEVETPILCTAAGGAAANPFTTTSRALHTDLFLRIAPELYLKQLVIGGMDRVFEIGKVFRNEGVDQSHNPEFTMCEFYQAYADYNTFMTTAEDMLSGLVQSVNGSYNVEWNGQSIDFSPPFKRISILEGLEEALGEPLPAMDDPELVPKLLAICDARDVVCPKPHTPARVIDCLIGEYLEPQCVNPTFLIHHPALLSPLAKAHRDDPLVTERFELFVGGKELCNAYTELNDPDEQRERFATQTKDRETGDTEAHVKDEAFCHALEFGLPPTAGFGIGIDRLVMMLTGMPHIREVILFPTMKPTQDQ